MGRLPHAWIAPPETRELRELVRHRAKLVAMRSQCKAHVHAVLAKGGVWVPMTDLFGVEGNLLLDMGRRPTRRSAPRRTGAATCRPSAAPPAPALRPPCSTGPRRSPARSATATPAPATTYAAASTASASRAPPRSTPAPPSAAHVMLYANHPTRQRDSPRNTASAHRLQLCNEFQAQDTRCALNPSAGRAVVASECALRPVRHMPSKLALAFESDEFPCRTTLFIE